MDLSKPHIIFGASWALTFLLALLIETNLSVAFGLKVYILTLGSIAIFFLAAALSQILVRRAPVASNRPVPCLADQLVLSRFMFLLFLAWAATFAVTIAYSGGIPIYWRLIGDSRNYLDFGLPTVSGLTNMMRCFIVAGVVALLVLGSASRRDILIGGICLASAFAEISRGSIIAVVLHGVAMYVFLRPIQPRQLFLGLFVLWAGLFAFEWIGNNRTAGYDADFGAVLGGKFEEGGILSQFIWTFIYITTPFNNLAYALSQNYFPTMVPYYTLQPLVPTAIRNLLFTPGDYPIELLNEAFNATTAYSPLLADFGMEVAMLVFAFIAIVISFSYTAAKRGSLFNILCYPPIFTSVVLSFFYSYFFALPVVLYPALVWAFMIYRRRAFSRVLHRDRA